MIEHDDIMERLKRIVSGVLPEPVNLLAFRGKHGQPNAMSQKLAIQEGREGMAHQPEGATVIMLRRRHLPRDDESGRE